MSSCHEPIKLNKEKPNSVESSRSSEQTKHWVRCEAGVQNKPNAQQTECLSETCGSEDCSESVVQKQRCSSVNGITTNDTRLSLELNLMSASGMACSPSKGVNAQEMCPSSFKPYICTMYGDSFIDGSSLVLHQKTHATQL